MASELVPIKLDRERHLRFRPSSAVLISQLLTIRFGPELLQADMDSLYTLMVFLYAGLRWEDQALTLEAVGDMVEDYLDAGGSIGDLGMAIAESVKGAHWIALMGAPKGPAGAS